MSPVPVSYSETELKSFMATILGPVADALGWTVVANSFDEAVTDTLLAYGESDIADATDITKLRALAAVAVWRQAQQAAAGLFNWSTFGDKYDMADVQSRIAKSLALAESNAVNYSADYAVAFTNVRFSQDPYRSVLDSDSDL